MKNIQHYDPLLELIDRPTFLVRDGSILQANQAARQQMVVPGDPINKYLDQDLPAYEEFSNGCLYLTLTVAQIPCGATVVKLEDAHLFLLDEQADAQLKALSLAAQQLRVPMNTVFLIAESMDDQKKASQLAQTLSQMHRIICNMSDAALYQQHYGFCGEVTDLNQFFAETVEKAAALLRDTGIQLKYSALPQAVTGVADRQMLERAVLNLISNAVKFSPEQGVVEIRLTHKKHMLYFTIHDSGSGMDPEVQKTAFSRYMRNPGIEDIRNGLGLGLSVVRSAAANHGGTVLIDHPETGGTRVTMTLDLQPKEDGLLRSPVRIPTVDYAGGYDHTLLELSDVLPSSAYKE